MSPEPLAASTLDVGWLPAGTDPAPLLAACKDACHSGVSEEIVISIVGLWLSTYLRAIGYEQDALVLKLEQNHPWLPALVKSYPHAVLLEIVREGKASREARNKQLSADLQALREDMAGRERRERARARTALRHLARNPSSYVFTPYRSSVGTRTSRSRRVGSRCSASRESDEPPPPLGRHPARGVAA